MKTVSKKQIKHFSYFLIVSGIGALWLTWNWKRLTLDRYGDGFVAGVFENIQTYYYYLSNSFLLCICSGLFLLKQFRLFSYLSLILCFTVTLSWFVFSGDGRFTLPLFIYTIQTGMIVGAILGGIVLVPMFIIAVYKSAYRSIQYLRGKITYDENSETSIINESSSNSSSIILPEGKTKFLKVLSLFNLIFLAFILVRIIYIIRLPFILNNLKNPWSISFFISIILLILSIITLKNKNKILYFIINSIIIIFELLFVIYFLYL